MDPEYFSGRGLFILLSLGSNEFGKTVNRLVGRVCIILYIFLKSIFYFVEAGLDVCFDSGEVRGAREIGFHGIGRHHHLYRGRLLALRLGDFSGPLRLP